MPYFQDIMAKAAVETLSILTDGGTKQCEQKIKNVNFFICFIFDQTNFVGQ